MAYKVLTIKTKKDWSKTREFLEKVREPVYDHLMKKYGEMGVKALKANTPVDTGKTAESWSYEIVKGEHGDKLIFNNSNVNKHINIAIILQYGYATRNGGWVEGRDYINPAIQPVFDKMAKELWLEVTRNG